MTKLNMVAIAVMIVTKASYKIGGIASCDLWETPNIHDHTEPYIPNAAYRYRRQANGEVTEENFSNSPGIGSGPESLPSAPDLINWENKRHFTDAYNVLIHTNYIYLYKAAAAKDVLPKPIGGPNPEFLIKIDRRLYKL